MSKKSVASIKTLARYEPDTVYIGTGEYVAECVRADDGDYYLAADVDAAIEALRAEVAEWKRVAVAQAELQGEAEERAEKLAGALRVAREYVVSELAAERDKFAGYEHCSNIASIEADLAKIDALLRDQEEGK